MCTVDISGFSSIIHQSVLIFRIFSRQTVGYLFLHLHPLHSIQVLYYSNSFPDTEIPRFNFLIFCTFSEPFLKQKNKQTKKCSPLLYFSLGFVIFLVHAVKCGKETCLCCMSHCLPECFQLKLCKSAEIL